MSDNICEKIRSGEESLEANPVDRELPKFSKEEESSLNKAKFEYQLEKNKDIAHNRFMRKDIADKVYRFLVGWSISLFAILILQGWVKSFNLSDTILVTLCGGTTVSTIGLVGFIVRGLFVGKEK